MNPLLEKYFSLVSKIIPTKAQSTTVGLDIGVKECKLVEMGNSPNGHTLLNWAIEPINNNDIPGSVKACLEHLDAPCHSVNTAIYGKGTLIRYLDLPRMTLSDLKNSFSIEADKYFPFAQDQIYTDCYILDPLGKTKQMPVLAAAAKKELIDQRIALLTSCELQSDLVGINSIVLGNAINVLGAKDNLDSQTFALLDIGESASCLIIIKDKVPRFIRDIYIGGKDFTKRISNSLGVSAEEAEKIKINPGDKLASITAAYESVLMNIIQELRLSFDYFTTENNSEISHILITGGASQLQGIEKVIEENLGFKVGAWDPLFGLTMGTGVSEEEVKQNAYKLGVAIGLALY